MPSGSDLHPTQPPAIKINGTKLSEEVYRDLSSIRVDLSMHQVSVVELRFKDFEFTHVDDATFTITNPIEVGFVDEQNAVTTVFKGEIVGVALEDDSGDPGGTELVVTAMDKGHRLAGFSQHKSYLKMKRSDIVSQIASRHGLSADATASTATEDFLMQTVSDHEFITELAEADGYEWWVDGDKLLYKPRSGTSAMTFTRNEDLLMFNARASGIDAGVKAVKVRGWDPGTQAAVTGEYSVNSATSVTDVGTTATLAADGAKKARNTWGGDLVLPRGGTTSAAEAKAIATAVGKRLAADAMVVTGESYVQPALKPGQIITIAKVGTRLSGDYFVTDVVHIFSGGQAGRTRFRLTGRDALPMPATRRPAPRWGYDGLVVGVVSNLNDPDKAGRVKVKFAVLDDQVESAWAIIASPGAGAKHGFFNHPEVGDEVVIGFAQSDFRYPIILGGLYSKKNPPALDAELANNLVGQRGIVSRVGHKMVLADGPSGAAAGSADRFFMVDMADGKTKLRLGEDKIDITADSGKAISIKAGSTEITFSTAGDITIKGANVTIEAQTKLVLKGQQVEMTGTQVKIEGSGQLEAKGAAVNVQGSGMTAVKGNPLMLN